MREKTDQKSFEYGHFSRSERSGPRFNVEEFERISSD